ncbi:MAG: TRAP transporter large permease subunit [Alphaproteobacteria bacterium]|nr:TRAP transporter large permease subunit [Alphaproteobacteria bacterium]
MEFMALSMFAVACLFLITGFPVAFTLSGVALLFALLGMALGMFDYGFLLALPQRIYGTMRNEVLIAVPLFIFMGTMLERSRIAEDLLENMGLLFGKMRGGLGISVILVGALLAASTGIVGATVVTMGLLSLPTMLKHGYSPSLAAGSISAAGTLGQIIPPSIVLILLGDVIANAYQKAQLEMGIFAPDTVSVGELFAGALLPGLLLVGVYILYQFGLAFFRPDSSPAMQSTKHIGIKQIIKTLLPPIALIIAVLGSILTGITTPTEAAAIGAIGALLLAGERLHNGSKRVRLAALSFIVLIILANVFDLRMNIDMISLTNRLAIAAAMLACGLIILGLGLSLRRTYQAGILREVMETTARITSMVFIILIGAALFSLVFRGLEGDVLVQELLVNLPGGAVTVMVIVMLIMFLLGFFLDFIEIIFVVAPIVAPILLQLGFDPVWLGVMMAINLQTSFLTPPFGFALFYLRGVAPEQVQTSAIYKGVIPFVFIQIIMLVMLALFPTMATWFPQFIFN